VPHKKPSCFDSLKDTVDYLHAQLKKSSRFVRYFKADLDLQYDLLMLITELCPFETLRQFIDQYGFFDEATAGTMFLNFSENNC
jgi:RNAse (barnase) inhibitor barstar